VTYFRPGTFLGVTGALGELVFEWNRTDITQFSGSSPDFSDELSGDASASVLSVETHAERGEVLRMAANPSAVDMAAVWLVTAPIVFPDTRRDFVFILDIATQDTSASADRSFGVAFLCNDAADHAFIHGIGNRTKGIVINNGTVTQSTTVPVIAATDSAKIWQIVRGVKPAADAPQCSSYLRVWNHAGAAPIGDPRRSGSDATARGALGGFGADPTLGATWDGEDLDRIGIALASDNGQDGPVSVDILDFRVYLVGE